MGNFLKRILGIALPFVAPFVAPSVATAFNVSSSIGRMAISAGIGAATAKVAGGDPIKGAMIGATGSAMGLGATNPMTGISQPGITNYNPASAGGASFMNSIVPQSLQNLFGGQAGFNDAVLQTAVQIGAQWSAGSGLNPEEERNREELRQWMETLKARDNNLYNQLLNTSKEQFKTAGQYNPQHYGNLRANLEKNKWAVQAENKRRQAGLGSYTKGDEQRSDIDRSLAENTAFLQGQAAGADLQSQHLDRAMNTLTSASNVGGQHWNRLKQLGNVYSDDRKAKDDAVKGWQETYGSIAGIRDASAVQNEIDELQKKLRELRGQA